MFKGSNNVALGYDEGSILIKVGQSVPCTSCVVISLLPLLPLLDCVTVVRLTCIYRSPFFKFCVGKGTSKF